MSKLRKSARGKPCHVQLFPHCNQDPETTVLAHINSASKGMGVKSEDWFAVYACSSCHDVIDGRVMGILSKQQIIEQILRGLHQTWRTMINEGLVNVGKQPNSKHA